MPTTEANDYVVSPTGFVSCLDYSNLFPLSLGDSGEGNQTRQMLGEQYSTEDMARMTLEKSRAPWNENEFQNSASIFTPPFPFPLLPPKKSLLLAGSLRIVLHCVFIRRTSRDAPGVVYWGFPPPPPLADHLWRKSDILMSRPLSSLTSFFFYFTLQLFVHRRLTKIAMGKLSSDEIFYRALKAKGFHFWKSFKCREVKIFSLNTSLPFHSTFLGGGWVV